VTAADLAGWWKALRGVMPMLRWLEPLQGGMSESPTAGRCVETIIDPEDHLY